MTFSANKSPIAQLPYTLDWSDWLNGDAITTATVTVPDGITLVSQSNTANMVTAVLSGGAINTYYAITYEVLTAAGLQDERTLSILVTNR